ncbi:MAG: hypothetical protein JXQ96_20045, partial [Cyclobacteriaceae bacterium]
MNNSYTPLTGSSLPTSILSQKFSNSNSQASADSDAANSMGAYPNKKLKVFSNSLPTTMKNLIGFTSSFMFLNLRCFYKMPAALLMMIAMLSMSFDGVAQCTFGASDNSGSAGFGGGTTSGAQSFTTTCGGVLKEITLQIESVGGPVTIDDVTIYLGNGSGGAQQGQLTSLPDISSTGDYVIDFTSENIILSNATQYTVWLTTSDGDVINFRNDGDNYAGGSAWISGLNFTTFDVTFQVEIVPSNPSVVSISRNTPPSEFTNDDLVTFEVVFSEAASFTTSSFNVALPGSSPMIDAVTGTGTNTASIDVDGIADANGVLSLTVTLANVEDLFGNTITTAAPAGENYTIDNVVPTVTSIVRTVPTDAVTNADAVTFTITLSQSSNDFTEADVTLTGDVTGSPVKGTMSAGPASVYTLQITSLDDENGTLGLTVTTGSFSDLAGNTNATNAATGAVENYTLDNTIPTITSITRKTPTDEFTNADDVDFEVVFSEIVTFTTASFSSSIGDVNSVSGSAGMTATVNIDMISSADALLDLDVVGMNVTDAGGNTVTNETPTGTEETYTIDNTDPKVVSVNRSNPTAEYTNQTSVSFEVVFDEAVSFTSSGFTVNDGSIDNVFGSGGMTATVNVISIAANAVLSLTVVAAQIDDLAGNGLSAPSPSPNQSYIFDDVLPTVVSISRDAPSNTRTFADVVDFEVVFSEDVNFTTANFTSSIGSVNAVAGSGSMTATVSINGIASANGTLNLDVVNNSVQDIAGNTMTTATPGSEEEYIIDNTLPTVTSITRNDPTAEFVNNSEVTFEVTFSEALSASVGNFIMEDAAGVVGNIKAGSVTATGVDTYEVTVENINTDGIVALDIDISSIDIFDATGNTMTDSTPSSEEKYTIDTTKPIVTNIRRFNPSAQPTNSNTVQFQVTFNEPVSFTTASFDATLSGETPVVSSVVESSGMTATVEIASGIDNVNGELSLTVVVDNVADPSGNTVTSATASGDNQTFIIDNINPTIENIFRKTPGTEFLTDETTVVFEVDFSEDNLTYTAADFTTSLGSVVSAVPGTGADKVDVTVNIAHQNGVIDLGVVASSISDPAGELLTNTTVQVTEETYSNSDTQGPTITSITRDTPTGAVTNADQVTFQVVYNEPVTIDNADFSADLDGAGRTIAGTSGSGMTVTVDVSGIESDNGVLSLSVTIANVEDLNGNTITSNVVGSEPETYTIDNIAPSINSITRSNPLAEVTNLDAVTFKVTFDEEVLFNTSGFTVAPFGTVDSATGSGTMTATVGVNNIANDNGVLNLSVDTNNVADAAGNSVTGSEVGEETYTLDNTAPSAMTPPNLVDASDTGISATDNITTDDTPTFEVEASEAGTITIYSDVEGGQIAEMYFESAGIYQMTATTLTAGVGTVHAITCTKTDAIGNESLASAPLNITVDDVAPTLDAITLDSNTITSNTTMVFNVSFSETVYDIEPLDFSVSVTDGGVEGATVTSVSANSGSSIDVTIEVGQGAAQIALELDGGGDGITDAAGAPVGSFTSGPAYSYATNVLTVTSSTDATEGDAVTFKIERTSDEDLEMIVYYSIDADDPSDYDDTNAGSVTIAAGANSVTVSINVVDDTRAEGDEDITLTIETLIGERCQGEDCDFIPFGGPIFEEFVTYITDDPDSQTAVIEDTDNTINVTKGANINEGSSSSFTFTLVDAVSGVTVTSVDKEFEISFTTNNAGSGSGGTTVDDTNLPASGTVTISAGSMITAVQGFLAREDNLVETNTTENISISVVDGSALTVTANYGVGTNAGNIVITDTDEAIITLDTSDQIEGNGGLDPNKVLTMTVTLTQAGIEDGAEMAFATYTGGTATGGNTDIEPNDYRTNTGTITFGAGVSPMGATQTIDIELFGNDIVEADETIFVRLSLLREAGKAPGSGTPGFRFFSNAATEEEEATILNDDTAYISINTPDPVAEEDGSISFRATLIGNVDQAFTVSYQTINGDIAGITTGNPAYTNEVVAGKFGLNDYVDASNDFNFGGNDGDFSDAAVTINDDAIVELDEIFALLLNAINLPADYDVFFTENGGMEETAPVFLISYGTITNTDAATVTITSPGDFAEADAGTTERTFTVSLSDQVDVPITVDYSFTDGTAVRTGTADYIATNGSVTFPGENTQDLTFTVDIVGDEIVELDEDFDVTLTFDTSIALNEGTGNPSRLSSNSATVTAGGLDFGLSEINYIIENNDAAILSISNAVNEVEAGTATITVTTDNEIDVDVSINVTTYDLNAISANSGAHEADFVSIASQTVTITAGNFSQDFEVSFIDDMVVETDEEFTVNMDGGSERSAGTLVSAGVIDLVDTGVRDVSISTGNSTTLATIDNDDSTEISITIDDAVQDESDNFTFIVTNTSRIDTGFDVNFTVIGSGIQPTETADIDPSSTSSPISFDGLSVGEQQTITVNIVDDNIVEMDELFNVSLISLSSEATFDGRISTISSSDNIKAATITDNDVAVITIADEPAPSAETNTGTQDHVFIVSISNPVDVPITIPFDVVGEVVTADYDTPTPATEVVFTANSTTAQTITVPAFGETLVEDDEELTILLTAINGDDLDENTGSNAVNLHDVEFALDPNSATSIITNDDSAIIEISDVPTISEGTGGAGYAEYVITLSEPVEVDVSVDVVFMDSETTASMDYDPSSAYNSTNSSTLTMTFPAGDNTPLVYRFYITDDDVVEDDESYSVTLTNLTLDNDANPDSDVDTDDVTFGANSSTMTEIQDNDAALISFSSPTYSFDETDGLVIETLTVNLSSTVEEPFTIDYSTFGITANTGSIATMDFDEIDAATLTLENAGNYALTITLNGDTVVEADPETFDVGLSNININTDERDISFGTNTATVSIDDDDFSRIDIFSTNVDEGAGANTYTIVLTNQVDIDFTIDISTLDGGGEDEDDAKAQGGQDFVAITTTPVTFVAGSTSSVQYVTIIDDDVVEYNQSFRFRGTNIDSGIDPRDIRWNNAGTGSGENENRFIIDNDEALLSVSAPVDADEGDSGLSNFVWTVSLADILGDSKTIDTPVTISYEITGEVDGSDYDDSLNNGDIVLPQSATFVDIAVGINGDLLVEDNEEITLTITSVEGFTNTILAMTPTTYDRRDVSINEPTANSATANVLNDDASEIIITSINPTVDENVGSVNYTISMSQKVESDVTFDVIFDANELSAGTASISSGDFDNENAFALGSLPGDIWANSVTITFSAGDNADKTLIFDFHDDDLVEDDEEFTLTLDNLFVSPVEGGTPTLGLSINDAVEISMSSNTVSTDILDEDEAIVSFTSATYSIGENGNNVIAMTVTLSADVEEEFAVQYYTMNSTGPGSANTGTIGNTDYTEVSEASNTQLTSLQDQGDYHIEISLADDNIVELDEIFGVIINDTFDDIDWFADEGDDRDDERDVSFNISQSTVTIVDPDYAVVIQDESVDLDVDEGVGANTHTFRLSNPVDASISFNIGTLDGTEPDDAGEAREGIDFTDLSTILTFDPEIAGPGNNQESATVSIIDDDIVEYDQIYSILVSSLSANGRDVRLNEANSITVTYDYIIEDNDDTRLTISSPTPTNEGDSGLPVITFTVSSANLASQTKTIDSDVRIDYAITGDVTATQDYVVGSGFVTLSAGDPTVDIPISIVGDNVIEPDEDITLSITGISGFTVTVLDADEPRFDERDIVIDEPSGNSATTTVLNDDQAEITIVKNAAGTTVDEGVGSVSYTISLTQPIDRDVTLDVLFDSNELSPASPSGNDDYNEFSAFTLDAENNIGVNSITVTFDQNTNADKLLTFNFIDDDLVEDDEDFTLTLDNLDVGENTPMFGSLEAVAISSSTSTVTTDILDDDQAIVSFSSSTYSVNEDGNSSVSLELTLSKDVEESFTIQYYTITGTSDGAANFGTLAIDDFEPVNQGSDTQTGDFELEETAYSIVIDLGTDDSVVELDETFSVVINDAFGDIVWANSSTTDSERDVTFNISQATVTIVNAESANVVLANNQTFDEAGELGTHTYTLSSQVDYPIQFEGRTQNGGDASVLTEAFDGVDYVGVNKVIVFPVGDQSEALTVTIINDDVVEYDKEYIVQGTNLQTQGRDVQFNNLGAIYNRNAIIVDDDVAEIVIANPSDFTETDSGTPDLLFTVTIEGTDGNTKTIQEDITITYSVSTSFASGSATNSEDLLATALDSDWLDDNNVFSNVGSIDLNATDFATFSLPIKIIGDNIVEPDESISVTILSVTDFEARDANGPPNTSSNRGDIDLSVSPNTNTGTTTIIDNDVAEITISGPADVSEGIAGGIITYTANMSNVASETVTFEVTMNEDELIPGEDFDDVGNVYNGLGDNPATIVFPAGTTSGFYTFEIIDDNLVEADEDFNLTLDLDDISGLKPGDITASTNTLVTTVNDNDFAYVYIEQDTYEGNEDDGAITFRVSVDKDIDADFLAFFSTSDGTGLLSDSDYTQVSSGTVTIGSLNTTVASESFTFEVIPTADNKVEADETFNVQLGALSGFGSRDIRLANGTGGLFVTEQATIINDDNAVVTLEGPNDGEGINEVDEGDIGLSSKTYVLRLSDPVDVDVSVSYITADGTATTGDSDYQASSGQVTFFANSVAGASQTFVVNVVGDETVELDEEFDVQIFNLNSAQTRDISIDPTASSQTTSINNDDASALNIEDATVQEGNGVTKEITFDLTLSNEVDAPVGVSYYLANGGFDGSTMAKAESDILDGVEFGQDYQDESGTILFTTGSTTQSVTITINSDTDVELDQIFTVNLEDIQTAGMTVTVPQINETVRDVAFLSAGTSTTLVSDQAEGTIENDDSAELTISAVNTSVVEGATATTTEYTFDVALDNNVDASIRVVYELKSGITGINDAVVFSDIEIDEVSGNTATTSSFSRAIGTVAINNIDIIGDGTVELDEGFSVELISVVDADGRNVNIATGGGEEAFGQIDNDDSALINILTAGNVVEMNEGEANTATFTVTLSSPVDVDVTVQHATGDDEATAGDGDFTSTTGTTTFLAHTTTSQTIDVPIIGDNKVELSEFFDMLIDQLVATDGTGVRDVSINLAQNTARITNDDAATIVVSDGTPDFEGDSGTTDFDFLVTLSSPVDADVEILYNTVDGTASANIAPFDFTSTSGTLVFPAEGTNNAQTITVPVIGDLILEGDEVFELEVQTVSLVNNGRAVTVADSRGETTILNDERPFFTISDVSQSEGVDGATTTFEFTVDLDFGPDPNDIGQNVTVDLTLNEGTATFANSDLVNALSVTGDIVSFDGTTLTLNGNSDTNTATVIVEVIGDDVLETDEEFTITLSNALPVNEVEVSVNANSNTGTGTIEDDDDRLIEIDAGSLALEQLEESGSMTITINMDGTSDEDITVPVVVTGISATEMDDYTLPSPSEVVILAGETSADYVITFVDELIVEGDETFSITLGAPTSVGNLAVTIDGSQSTTGTILNSDVVEITLSTVTGTIPEGAATGSNDLVFRVTLDNPVDGGLALSYSTQDILGGATAGVDYNTSAGNLDFTGNAGEFMDIFVGVNPDDVVELAESFEVELSSVTFNTLAVDTDSYTNIVDSPQTGTITNDDNAIIRFTAATVTENEENGSLRFLLEMDNQVDVNVSFDVVASTPTGIDAVEFADYEFPDGDKISYNVTFSPLQTSQTLDITILQENLVELDEKFVLTMTGLDNNSRNVTISGSNGSSTGTINNNDQAQVTIATVDGSATEGNSSTFGLEYDITINNPVEGGVTVSFNVDDVTATETDNVFTDNLGQDDYVAPMTQTISWGDGVVSTQSITIQVLEDDVVERASETLNITLGSFSGTDVDLGDLSTAGGTLTGTITDDDAAEITFGVTTFNQSEDNTPMTITLEMSNYVDSDVTVAVAYIDGTALDGGDDFTLPSTDPVFIAGTKTLVYSIDLVDDDEVEPDETFELELGDPDPTTTTTFPNTRQVTSSTITTIGTIDNDDSAELTISALTATFTEGDVGTQNMVFRVSLNTPVKEGFDISYSAVDITAEEGVDYSITGNLLNFTGDLLDDTPSGYIPEVRDIIVQIQGDEIVEQDSETFSVNLAGAVAPKNAGVSAGDIAIIDNPQVGKIIDDDQTILTIANVAGAEDGGPVAVTIESSNEVEDGFTIDVSSIDISADSSTDYAGINQTIAFAGGVGEAQVFNVVPAVDAIVEGDETLTISIDAINSGTITFNAGNSNIMDTGTVTILNDDQTILSFDNPTEEESASPTTVTVTSSLAVQGGFTIAVLTTDGTADSPFDFTAIAGTTTTLNFSGVSGETRTFNVATKEDNLVEIDESFTVGFNTGSYVGPSSTNVPTFDGTGTGTVTILNDDRVTVTVSDASGPESSTGIPVTISIDNPVQGGFTVNASSFDGSATLSGNDYNQIASELVTFGDGSTAAQTVTLVPVSDAIVENNENLTIGLAAYSGPTSIFTSNNIGDTGSVTITNDDTTIITIDDVSGAEDGGAMSVTVNSSLAVQGGFTIAVSTTGITALGGTDYENIVSEVVTFGGTPNEDVVFALTPTAEFIVESDETLSIGIDSYTGPGSSNITDDATLTILNDDQTVLTLNEIDVDESIGSATITIASSLAVQDAFSIRVSTSDGTASTASGDYDAVSSQLISFPSGISAGATQTVVVTISDDEVVETDETIDLSFDGGSFMGAVSTNVTPYNADDTGEITIENNDVVTVSIAENFAGAEDDGEIEVVLTVDREVQGGFSVLVNSANGTATLTNADYTRVQNQLISFAGNDVAETQAFTVTITTDDIVEIDETLSISMANYVGPTSVNPTNDITDTGLVTIENDDQTVLTIDDVSASEADAQIVVDVESSNRVQGGFTVEVYTVDGTVVAALSATD